MLRTLFAVVETTFPTALRTGSGNISVSPIKRSANDSSGSYSNKDHFLRLVFGFMFTNIKHANTYIIIVIRLAISSRLQRDAQISGILQINQYIYLLCDDKQMLVRVGYGVLLQQLREHDKRSKRTCTLTHAQMEAHGEVLTTATVRLSGVSSLLPPNEDIPLSFSMNSMSGSESIKSSILTSLSVSTFAALF